MHFCEVTQFCIASLLANIGSLSLLVPSVAEMSMTVSKALMCVWSTSLWSSLWLCNAGRSGVHPIGGFRVLVGGDGGQARGVREEAEEQGGGMPTFIHGKGMWIRPRSRNAPIQDCSVNLNCLYSSFMQKLRSECKKKEKPVGLMDEDNPKAVELKARFDAVASTVTDNVAKAETLCICWDKLNDDVQELTKALRRVSPPADRLHFR